MLIDVSQPDETGCRRMRRSDGPLTGGWVATILVPEYLQPWLSIDGLELSLVRDTKYVYTLKGECVFRLAFGDGHRPAHLPNLPGLSCITLSVLDWTDVI